MTASQLDAIIEDLNEGQMPTAQTVRSLAMELRKAMYSTLFNDLRSNAIISDCGQYRYRLDRAIRSNGPVYAFFGINPSTADAYIDDATVRKWRGFVDRWGGSRFIVGNVFSFRATDVKELSRVNSPIGPLNDRYLHDICEEADILVPCWGDRAKLSPHLRSHLDYFLSYIHAVGKATMCFGLTKCGDPMHPLMLGYNTELIKLS